MSSFFSVMTLTVTMPTLLFVIITVGCCISATIVTIVDDSVSFSFSSSSSSSVSRHFLEMNSIVDGIVPWQRRRHLDEHGPTTMTEVDSITKTSKWTRHSPQELTAEVFLLEEDKKVPTSMASSTISTMEKVAFNVPTAEASSRAMTETSESAAITTKTCKDERGKFWRGGTEGCDWIANRWYSRCRIKSRAKQICPKTCGVCGEKRRKNAFHENSAGGGGPDVDLEEEDEEIGTAKSTSSPTATITTTFSQKATFDGEYEHNDLLVEEEDYYHEGTLGAETSTAIATSVTMSTVSMMTSTTTLTKRKNTTSLAEDLTTTQQPTRTSAETTTTTAATAVPTPRPSSIAPITISPSQSPTALATPVTSTAMKTTVTVTETQILCTQEESHLPPSSSSSSVISTPPDTFVLRFHYSVEFEKERDVNQGSAGGGRIGGGGKGEDDNDRVLAIIDSIQNLLLHKLASDFLPCMHQQRRLRRGRRWFRRELQSYRDEQEQQQQQQDDDDDNERQFSSFSSPSSSPSLSLSSSSSFSLFHENAARIGVIGIDTSPQDFITKSCTPSVDSGNECVIVRSRLTFFLKLRVDEAGHGNDTSSEEGGWGEHISASDVEMLEYMGRSSLVRYMGGERSPGGGVEEGGSGGNAHPVSSFGSSIPGIVTVVYRGPAVTHPDQLPSSDTSTSLPGSTESGGTAATGGEQHQHDADASVSGLGSGGGHHRRRPPTTSSRRRVTPASVVVGLLVTVMAACMLALFHNRFRRKKGVRRWQQGCQVVRGEDGTTVTDNNTLAQTSWTQVHHHHHNARRKRTRGRPEYSNSPSRGRNRHDRRNHVYHDGFDGSSSSSDHNIAQPPPPPPPYPPPPKVSNRGRSTKSSSLSLSLSTSSWFPLQQLSVILEGSSEDASTRRSAPRSVLSEIGSDICGGIGGGAGVGVGLPRTHSSSSARSNSSGGGRVAGVSSSLDMDSPSSSIKARPPHTSLSASITSLGLPPPEHPMHEEEEEEDDDKEEDENGNISNSNSSGGSSLGHPSGPPTSSLSESAVTNSSSTQLC